LSWNPTLTKKENNFKKIIVGHQRSYNMAIFCATKGINEPKKWGKK
jgi:hypothetical protein